MRDLQADDFTTDSIKYISDGYYYQITWIDMPFGLGSSFTETTDERDRRIEKMGWNERDYASVIHESRTILNDERLTSGEKVKKLKEIMEQKYSFDD